MFGKPSLTILRSLTRELRCLTPDGKVLDEPLMQWILSEYRSNKITSAKYCHGAEEMTWMANNYLQYIRSQRICNELLEKNQKPEKTVQETADMVGFRLPPSIPDDKIN